MIGVSIANQQEAVELDFARLKEIARSVFEGEGIRDGKVTFAFMEDAAIHRLNKQFLDHDEPTDVITFPYSGPKAKKLEGDVAVGVDVAIRQAAERGHDVGVELGLYVIHAALHLCGYDDLDDDDRKAMRSKEREYLQKLGLPDVAEA